MKILVFSDSHGHLSRVMEIYNKTRCQAVIFLGDGLRDAQGLYSVSGSQEALPTRSFWSLRADVCL